MAEDMDAIKREYNRDILANHADWLEDQGGPSREMASRLRSMLASEARLTAEVERLKADNAAMTKWIRLEQPLEGGHPDPDVCPVWNDGCNCTLSTLVYNIERAEQAEAAVERIRLELVRKDELAYQRGCDLTVAQDALAAAQKGEYPCHECGAVTIRCAGPLQDEYEAKLAAANERAEKVLADVAHEAYRRSGHAIGVRTAVEYIRKRFAEALRPAAPPEARMPRDWKHTEKCLTGAPEGGCICWPPEAKRD